MQFVHRQTVRGEVAELLQQLQKPVSMYEMRTENSKKKSESFAAESIHVWGGPVIRCHVNQRFTSSCFAMPSDTPVPYLNLYINTRTTLRPPPFPTTGRNGAEHITRRWHRKLPAVGTSLRLQSAVWRHTANIESYSTRVFRLCS
jgi:hypothetical protein